MAGYRTAVERVAGWAQRYASQTAPGSKHDMACSDGGARMRPLRKLARAAGERRTRRGERVGRADSGDLTAIGMNGVPSLSWLRAAHSAATAGAVTLAHAILGSRLGSSHRLVGTRASVVAPANQLRSERAQRVSDYQHVASLRRLLRTFTPPDVPVMTSLREHAGRLARPSAATPRRTAASPAEPLCLFRRDSTPPTDRSARRPVLEPLLHSGEAVA